MLKKPQFFLLFLAILMNYSIPVRPAENADLDAEHAAKLDEKVSELILENNTLQEAMILLQEKTHANILVLQKNLEANQYPLDKKLRLRLYDLELRQILSVLMKTFDESGVNLDFRLRDAVICVGSSQTLNDSKSAITLVYDIHDLVDRFLMPNDLLAAELRPIVGGGAMHAGVPEEPSTTQRVNPALPPVVTNFTRQENIDMITRLLEECVDPNSWRDNGGQVGNLKEFGGLLLVTQLPENQKQVETALRNFRKMRDAIDRGAPEQWKGIDLLAK